MWSNCFCFVLLHLASYLARQPVFQNKICFGNFIYVLPRDVNKPQNGLFQKKIKQGGGGKLRIYFCENCPGIFDSFTLSLKIPDKTKLKPWIFHTVVLPRSFRNSKAKNKDPWKFHIFSWSPLEIPGAISLIPLEIPYPQPPCLEFFWNSPIVSYIYIWLFFIIYQ